MKEEQLNTDEMQKRLDWYSKRYGPYIEKRGLHNWKNLFRKPTMLEWTILFMVLMALFISWAYQHDTSLCREALENLDETCIEYKTTYIQSNSSIAPSVNLSSFNISNG